MSDLSPLRRKIGAPRSAEAAPLLTPQRVWRRAITHGLTRAVGLPVQVGDVTFSHILPEDARELVEIGALLVLLDGPDGYGLALLEAPLVASILEMQTMGRVLRRAPVVRAVTATDAAMVADPLDHVLKAQETLAAEMDAPGMAAGYRFATHIDDPREIALTLADATHDHTRIVLTVGPAEAPREAAMHIVLPRPAARTEGGGADQEWADKMESRLLGTEVVVRAELARITLAVRAAQALAVGDTLSLPRTALGTVRMVTATGSMLSEGRLGQSAGRKAVRLGSPVEAPFELGGLPISLPED